MLRSTQTTKKSAPILIRKKTITFFLKWLWFFYYINIRIKGIPNFLFLLVGRFPFRLKERSGARRPYGVKAPRRRYAPPHRAIGNGDTDSHIMYGTMSRALYLITAA